MSYASILVHVQTQPESQGALHTARDLAQRFEATLIGVAAQAVPPAPFSDPLGNIASEWTMAMRDTVADNLKEAERTFRKACENLVKPAIFESGMQLPGPAVARAARAADLVVVNLPNSSHRDPFAAVAPGDLALEAGRPVLVVPEGLRELEGRQIVLAWKDSREARRAMIDALPFLVRAEEVLVLEVCAPDEERDAKIRTDDVAAALARHGVKARAKVVAHEPADAHQILRQASIMGADLIVSGAYGHSRLGEWIFGGVTRDLLAHTDRYLLLSH